MSNDSDWETMTESISSDASSSAMSSVPYASSELSIASPSIDGTPIDERIQRTNDLLKGDVQVRYDASCLKKHANWSKVSPNHNLVDYGTDPSILLADIKTHSPKLKVLLNKIKTLDNSDMREHGTHFKHLIFTDLKSNKYGVKLLASALIASGMTLGYNAEPIVNSKKRFGKIQMFSEQKLQQTKGNNLYILSSVTVFDQPISVATKKDILTRFNERPNNIHGDNVRIMVMDSGFKEGIDLFDIKYIHIFEPPTTLADQKQVIGRGTRTCGQKGLQFHPTKGWTLQVYIYDMIIPDELRGLMGDTDTISQLYLKSMNLDFRLVSFTEELERATIMGAVDHDLNENIHNFNITGGVKKTKFVIRDDLSPIVIRGDMPNELAFAKLARITPKRMTHSELKKHINDNFSDYKWEKAKMENLCEPKTGGYVYGKNGGYVYGKNGGYVYGKNGGYVYGKNGGYVYGGSSSITLTPTQEFLKNYFIPSNPVKGMLLWHSTGSGKTCSAIATASNEFEKAGYTILWVTKTTLKNDIWKNMFVKICNIIIRDKLKSGEIKDIPDTHIKRLELLGSNWIQPISYKQFTNMIKGKNKLYDMMVKRNGQEDPFKKTLIIIDEIHKIYSNTLSNMEKPNPEVLQNMIQKSYAVSGKNSLRLLLMSATPITNGLRLRRKKSFRIK